MIKNKTKEQGMTLIVKTVTRLVINVVFLYGIYIVLQSHTSPGGGFAGGVIIALSFILLMLAFGKDAVLKKLNRSKAIFIMSLAAVIFLFISIMGFITDQHRIETIPFSDIAGAFMVGMGLFVIFWALIRSTEGKE
ncbi:MAG: MnhB domain-containing protein [Candidatus Omnitrophica bacterium]|nr:MnhB domain-containing protein [Candidatus Omnitrophota bacterium]